MRTVLVALALFATGLHPAWCSPTLDPQRLLKNGSLRVELDDGTALIRYRDDAPFVPASVLKLATAFCALEELGQDYRFETLFFIDDSYNLFIRGSGDPSLISETLDSIADKLAAYISRVDQIIIDTTLFADDIDIDGSESSLNPYDAKNAAFVGNYSSAHLTHSKRGEVVSAEPQTPLTPISRQAGLRLPRGRTARVNLSADWRVGVKYGGELLAAFLRKRGVRGAMTTSLGKVPETAQVVLRHSSPQTLSDLARSMLEYSTNFTANQLFLVIGLKKHGAPATVDKGQEAMRNCLMQRVGWRDFHIEEGSGLSRKNQVTSAQMTDLLKSFERYSLLMPEKNGFIAKTGSLRGVSSLAGYFNLPGQSSQARFCILINSDVPHLYKFHVASEIRKYIEKNTATAESR